MYAKIGPSNAIYGGSSILKTTIVVWDTWKPRSSRTPILHLHVISWLDPGTLTGEALQGRNNNTCITHISFQPSPRGRPVGSSESTHLVRIRNTRLFAILKPGTTPAAHQRWQASWHKLMLPACLPANFSTLLISYAVYVVASSLALRPRQTPGLTFAWWTTYRDATS